MRENSQSGAAISAPSRTLGRDIAWIAAGTLVTALSAQVSVPWEPVPFTLQTLGVTLCGLTLGARKATASQVAYIAAGAAGAPVFAGGAGGPQHLLGPTAGYLVAFVVAAGLLGWLADRGWNRKALPAAGGLLIANAVILFSGAAWLSAYIGVEKAWIAGVLPFISGAVLKSIIALAIVPGFWRPKDC